VIARLARDRALCFVVALASCASAPTPAPAPARYKPTPQKEGVPAELLPELARAERIGRLLYELHHAADVGTAFLAEEVSVASRRELAGSATMVEGVAAPGARSFVSLFLTKDAPPRVAYRVHMPAGGKPQLEEVAPPAPADAALLAQLRARETVMARLPKWNGEMEVITLPGALVEAPGTLVVYALRQDAPGTVAFGMHYRAFVSPDGATLDRVEALSDIPELYKVVGDVVPTTSTFRLGHPSEADVFVSLAHDEQPLCLLTRRFSWFVVGASVGLLWTRPPDLDFVEAAISKLDHSAATAGMPASDLPKTLR
jgi:hypothetical protein